MEMGIDKKAVFFDRDGVLNHLVARDGSYYSPQKLSDFKIYSEAIEILKKIKVRGYLTIIISNQPDISRKKLEQLELNKITTVLFDKFAIDDVFYCTHDDIDKCKCRKPKPGLFHLAQEKYNINFGHSIMVGDTWKDVDAAKNVGIRMFLLDKDYNQDIQNVERIKKVSDILTLL